VRTRVDVEVPSGVEAPGIARRLVRAEFGAEAATVREDLELIVSELVTNAVIHGTGTVRLRLAAGDDAVRGEVIDEGTGFAAELCERGADECGGRGLWLVASIARSWGVHDGSSHVWFELAVHGAAPTSPRVGEEHHPEGLV